MPLYRVSSWGDEKNWQRCLRIPNLTEAVLARKEIWNFQFKLRVKEKLRIFIVEERESWVSL